MRQKQTFLGSVCRLAIPVALQAMLQSSFSIIDQIMLGQLGSVSIAAVGLAGKFTMILNVLLSSVGAVAGIMIAQYLGQKSPGQVRSSFRVNLGICSVVAVVFTLLCLLLPRQIMGLYTTDAATQATAAAYLRIVSLSFPPLALATLLSAWYRCMERAQLPMYASIAAAVCNTVLNYILIFGRFGAPSLGADGAAWATAVSQWVNVLIMLALLRAPQLRQRSGAGQRFQWPQYAAMLLPMLICELAWSLGENVYAGIYGHLGTDPCAAMTLLNPIQGMMTGALCGLSQAAGVIIGKRLGSQEEDAAYRESKTLLRYGFIAAIVLSGLIVLLRPLYVQIYQVPDSVKTATMQIMLAYAVLAPFKVQNMILGGGILRSGGKTAYVMAVDLIGTWIFGVPLGYLSALVLGLPIAWVYFILSLEEVVRYGISLVIFRRKAWMRQL